MQLNVYNKSKIVEGIVRWELNSDGSFGFRGKT